MTTFRPGRWIGLNNSLKLTAALVAAWAFIAFFAWLNDRVMSIWEPSLAAALCLIPGWLVFAIHSQYGTAAPLAVLLSATLGRMAAVVAGALAVKAAWPGLNMLWFALCLGVFYVLSLAIETKLLLTPPVRGTSADD